jgi:hypothetical protein
MKKLVESDNVGEHMPLRIEEVCFSFWMSIQRSMPALVPHEPAAEVDDQDASVEVAGWATAVR